MDLNDQKSLRLTIAIAIVLFLFTILITSLTSGLDAIVLYFSGWLEYKWLLLITISLFPTLAICIFYYRKLINIINTKQEDKSINQKKPYKSKRDIEQEFEITLSELANDEKLILSEYINKNVRALPFGMNNGTVRSLLQRNILTLPSGHWDGWKDPSFSINPIAMRVLKRNKHFLKND